MSGSTESEAVEVEREVSSKSIAECCIDGSWCGSDLDSEKGDLPRSTALGKRGSRGYGSLKQ